MKSITAGEVLKAFVDEVDNHYLIHIDMRLNAAKKDIYKHLVDYKNIYLLNNNIIESKIISSSNNQHQVKITTEGCVLFYCTRLVQIQNVTELKYGYIMVQLQAKQSDFHSGNILWHVWHDGIGTRVSFSADLVPSFWIPPIIGPWILSDLFYEESKQTINALERLSQKK